MNKLSNPVVFFTYGIDFSSMLRVALNSYVENTEHIHVSNNYSDEFLKSEIERVWQNFLQTSMRKSDIIRANFIFSETASELSSFIRNVEKFLLSLYPAGVLIDLFFLIENTGLPTENRKFVLDSLENITRDGLYLLSDLTSANNIVSRENIAQTIALLTLFKDCENTNLSDADRFNELFFLKNCNSRNDNFLTAGSAKLFVPNNSLKALIAEEILKYEPKIEIEMPAEPKFPSKRTPKSLEFLCGIAIPDANYNDPLTREQWILRLFGRRLEKIFSEHREPVPDDDFNPTAQNFYSLLRNTSDDGMFFLAANNAILTAKENLRILNENFVGWLEKIPERRTNVRKISPILSQDLFPFTLAEEFFRKKFEIEHAEKKIEILERRLSLIVKFHGKLQQYKEEIDAAEMDLQQKISEIDTVFQVFSDIASDYFRKKFSEYAETNPSDINRLHESMFASFRENNFAEFLSRLDSHIEEIILPKFSEPIVETLKNLTKNFPEALCEWIFQHNHIGIKLRTGYSKLYFETNLVMQNVDIFEIKKCYERRGLGRMNLFVGEQTNHIAVLYHAGAFDADEFYYSI